jgi:predicted ATPase
MPASPPDRRLHNLLTPLSSLVGRERETAAVVGLLCRNDIRLVTLTGPGGVGKTRLAIEVARTAGGRFVSLASTADAERVPALICDAVMVTRIPGESEAEALDRMLGRGPILLVLDNLEQMPDAAPLLAGLLERHTSLQLLATSRQPVGIQAERLFPVAPLAAGADAALFADRARARNPGFVVTEDNGPTVTEICERLAGLPLAIELAAARLGVLTPTDLAARLTTALAVLERGPRDAPARQRTLRATLDWSFDLLEPDEQDAFTALGTFAGGCELDAAQAVTGADLDVLEGLVSKSLVTTHEGRLFLLEPVRQYATERLAARADAEATHGRHFAHFVALAEHAEPELWARGRSAPCLASMRRELDNFAVALDRALAGGRTIDALALAGALGPWLWLTNASEWTRRSCARALAAAGDDAPAPLRARALLALGNGSAVGIADLERLAAALALFEDLGGETGAVRTLLCLSNGRSAQGDYDGARRTAEEALRRARQLGDAALIGQALGEIGLSIDRIEEALPFLREAAEGSRRIGAADRAVRFLTTAGLAALREDAYERSEELQRQALDAAFEVDDAFLHTLVQGNTGLAALLGGRHDAARAAFRIELTTAHAHGLASFYMEGLLGLAALAAADGDDHRAAVLDAAAWALNDRPVLPSEAPVYERVEQRFIAPARERLGSDAWEAASAGGRSLSADSAIALALEPALLPG